MIGGLFGKYRVLVFAIALFLIFDLGVLVLNFYTSGQIAEQTERINLAARQRTLTQQLSKATLYIKSQKLLQWPYQSGLDELENHYKTFGATLNALTKGGEVLSTQTEKIISIPAVLDPEGQAILAEAHELWGGFQTALAPLMVDILVTDEEITPASAFIARNNMEMFLLMNRLTNHFKELADEQTTFLRTAQVVGITLATLNFFIILFHFLRQLRTRDNELKQAHHESDQILLTIDEGVFLVNEDLRIGVQHSQYLEKIFNTQTISGVRLKRFLQRYLPRKAVSTAMEYVNLFFADHVSPDLVGDINPLRRVAANVENPEGLIEEKYLDFSFTRLRQSEGGSEILVTVHDVTDSVRLAEQEEQQSKDTDKQLMVLSQILTLAPDDLKALLRKCEDGFENMNSILRQDSLRSERYQNTIAALFREAHGLKGEASALSQDSLSQSLQEFETTLQNLRGKAGLKGGDFLPLTIQLKSMIDLTEQMGSMADRLRRHQINDKRDPELNNQHSLTRGSFRRWRNLPVFASNTATGLGKKAALHMRGFDAGLSEQSADVLYNITIQLIQNSLAHGIEHADNRKNSRKPETGQIGLTLSSDAEGNFRFIYEDDGAGFDYEKIRQRLVDSNLVSSMEQARELNKHELVRWTFRESFSTSDTLNEISGRGVGLPLVLNTINKLNGNLRIRSVANEVTQFIVDFRDNPLTQRAA
jgi:HPt (histidine-containing phosphotransfer) domain-containing protein